MQADTPLRLPSKLHALAAMASLLERLDRQPSTVSAEQYRAVVQQINTLLGEAEPGAALDALLAVAPATTELYENIQYAYAGLCRSPLDSAADAEVATKAALKRAAAH